MRVPQISIVGNYPLEPSGGSSSIDPVIIPYPSGGTTAPRSSFPDLTNTLKRLEWIHLWRRQVDAEIEQGIHRMCDRLGPELFPPQHRSEKPLVETDLIYGQLP